MEAWKYAACILVIAYFSFALYQKHLKLIIFGLLFGFFCYTQYVYNRMAYLEAVIASNSRAIDNRTFECMELKKQVEKNNKTTQIEQIRRFILDLELRLKNVEMKAK